MRFEHRELLWYTLLLLPALVAFFWWSWRRRKQLIAQFVQSRLLAHLTVGVSARRQKIRMAFLVFACVLLMVILARPQWGFSFEEARQRGLDVVVAIDTSRSMLAADVAPNRLARAKLAALDLKRLARTDRVGLVAFAGSAFLQCPLSFDDEAFRQNVNALDVNIIPQGGSALAEAIETARAAFERKDDNHKVLVLFTDGEDNVGEAIEVAKKAAKEGLRIFTVGVGTQNGELLRITDGKGRSDYIRDDQGNVVKSRLNEKLLRDMAQAADGFYMLLTGANTIELLYERGLAPLPKSEFSARHIKRYHERYQWFLGVVIVLLLTEMFLPERKRVRRTEAVQAPALSRAAAIILAMMVAEAAHASPARGLKQYEAGRYQAALREYRNALREKKDDARLHFNAGTAAYQAENYEKALEYLNSALITSDPDLQQRAYYNRGNTLYRVGEAASDPKEKMGQWEEALSSYESALKLNPNDVDAKFNHDLVKQKLEELKKQQEQQQQQQEQSKDDQKKDEKDKQQQQKQDQPKDQQQDQSKEQQDKEKQQEQQKQQQEQQKQQQQDQAQKEQQKKEQSKESQAQKGDKDKEQPQQGEGKPAQAMQMTPQQAMQLLDTQKGEERAMIFIPQLKTNRNNRVFKDW